MPLRNRMGLSFVFLSPSMRRIVIGATPRRSPRLAADLQEVPRTKLPFVEDQLLQLPLVRAFCKTALKR